MKKEKWDYEMCPHRPKAGCIFGKNEVIPISIDRYWNNDLWDDSHFFTDWLDELNHNNISGIDGVDIALMASISAFIISLIALGVALFY